MRWALLGVFCLSGAAGLVYEVTWTRMLGLVFGNTAYAVATTLAAFMGGLALGSALFGRRADVSPNPLRLYAGIELGIAVTGGLTPLVLPAISPALAAVVRAVGGVSGEVSPALTAVRFLVTSAVLLVPTVLMGATLPVLVRYFVRESRGVGSGVGTLYAVNTLGAVGGVFAAGFVLIQLLGVRHTLLLAAALNLLAAIVAWYAAGTWGQRPPEAEAYEEGGAALSGRQRRTALVLFGLSGAAALAYEVLLTRTLLLTLNTTTYAFAAMLTTFLAGIALGSALAGPLTRRPRNLPLAFGVAQLGIGVAVLGSVAVMAGLRPWIAELCRRLEIHGPPTLPIWLLQCFMAMLPATLLMGATFPIMSAIYARRMDALGRSVGDLYCANTIGAVAGSIAGGFVLLPLLGLRGSLLATACISLGLGVAAVALLGARGEMGAWPRARMPLVLGAVAAATVAAAPLLPSWDPRALLVSPDGADVIVGSPVFVREGTVATVAVFDGRGGSRYIEINAESASLTAYDARQTFSLLAHLPTLLHPAPRQALVIGFGAGLTLGGLTQHPDLARIVCVEISPEVLEAAPLFDEYNNRPLQDPRVEPIVNDGRNYLLLSEDQFDIITCDPIHPHAGGDAALYTLDFFALARDHLAPGGVFCEWLPMHGLRPDTYTLILRSFASAFPHAYLWFEGDYCVLIGAQQAVQANVDRIRGALRLPGVRADLDRFHLGDPVTLLAACVTYGAGLDRLAGPGPLHTDDHPHLEFEVSRTRDPWRAMVVGMLRDAQVPDPISLVGESVTEEFESALRRRLSARAHYLEAIRLTYERDLGGAVASFDRALALAPEAADIRYLRDYTADQVATRLARRMEEDVRAGDYEAAADLGRQLTRLFPRRAEYWASLGTVYHLMDRPEQAEQAARRAVALAPEAFDAHYSLGVALLKLERYDESVAHLEKAARLAPYHASPHLRLGMAYSRAGQRQQAIQAFRRALQLDPTLEIARQELLDLGAPAT